MTLEQAKSISETLQSYIGQTCKSGYEVKIILPLPIDKTEDDLKTFANLYLSANIDAAVKLTQTENSNFEVGVLSSDIPNVFPIIIGFFNAEFF